MNKYLPLVAIVLSCRCLLAQSSSTLIGARANGMGYASGCLSDEWSLFNNVAGLASIKSTTAAFAHDALPGFNPFHRTAAVFVSTVNNIVPALGVYRFGDSAYNEQMVVLGCGSTLGIASLGLKVNYIQYNAQGFGSKGLFSVSLGGIAMLTSNISIGAHIINLNQPRLSRANDERLPTTLVVGVLIKLSGKTIVTTELEKDLDFKAIWKTGFEYVLHKKFSVRSGINLYPSAAFFGMGFRPRNFSIDYAFQYNPQLASRHQASIRYTFSSTAK